MLEAVTPRHAPTSCPPTATDPRWSLWVAIAGSTMAFVDSTVVNVALPVMQRAMAATVDQMQWVVEAYTLTLATLVLLGGALGDRLGRRRVFVAGVLSFTVASALCGIAPSAGFLIAARAVQGVGAAMLVPGSLALIGAAYPEATRGAAIGTWSASTSIAAAIGPVLGGWVVGHASWRWVFFFNGPVGAMVALVAARKVPDTRDEDARGSPDVPGVLLAIGGLGALVWGLLEAPSQGGLGSPRTLGLLAAGAVALTAFVIVEWRAPSPMVPLTLFRSRTFAGANLLTLLLYAALGGCLFFVPFDLVQVQGYSPAAAGAALLPFVVLLSSLSAWAGSLVPRYGPRLPLVVGPFVSAVGFALLALPGVGGSYVTTFLPGIAVLGLGMGLTVAPLTTAVMGAVDVRHTGVASGINNAVARAAGLLAIAALGVVLRARFDHVLQDELARLPIAEDLRDRVFAERTKLVAAELPADLDVAMRATLTRALQTAFVAGFRALMLVGSALAALSSVVSLVLVEGRPKPSSR